LDVRKKYLTRIKYSRERNATAGRGSSVGETGFQPGTWGRRGARRD